MPKPTTLPESEVVANPKFETRQKRHRSTAEKLSIIAEADACTQRGELAALLRREKIYASQLNTWRQRLIEQGEQGLDNRPAGRRPLLSTEQREIEKLKKENEKLKKQVQIKDDLLALQKKAFSLIEQLDSENKS